MGQPGKLTVKGGREVDRAFKQLASDTEDMTAPNKELGQRLVGEVKRRTRRRTGTMAEAWIASGEPTRIAFTNPVPYAPVQEFGSDKLSITPTNAVKTVFDEQQEAITDGYGDYIKDRAKRRNIRVRR